jgi:hypothetical protein
LPCAAFFKTPGLAIFGRHCLALLPGAARLLAEAIGDRERVLACGGGRSWVPRILLCAATSSLLLPQTGFLNSGGGSWFVLLILDLGAERSRFDGRSCEALFWKRIVRHAGSPRLALQRALPHRPHAGPCPMRSGWRKSVDKRGSHLGWLLVSSQARASYGSAQLKLPCACFRGRRGPRHPLPRPAILAPALFIDHRVA